MNGDVLARRLAALVGVACIAAAGAALAAPAGTEAPAIKSLLGCRSITDNVQRLACYDQAAGSIAHDEASGDLVTIDRQQRRAIRHQAFGFLLPALGMFDRGEKAADLDRITATIRSAALGAEHRWIITLDDGAVWAQTDDSDVYPEPRPGEPITIRKGMLGSYFMVVRGNQMRAKRVG